MELPPESAARLSSTSHDTALCLVPPEHLWQPINRLRSLYDKAHGAWPPHVNLVYPFVRPEALPEAAELLCQLDLEHECPHQITLQHAGAFTQRRHNSIHLRPASKSDGPVDQGNGGPAQQEDLDALSRLSCALRRALGKSPDNGFQPHMTIAQSQDLLSDSHSFLLDKVRLLTPLSWQVDRLSILVREEAPHGSDAQRCMRLWGYIDIGAGRLMRPDRRTGLSDLPDGTPTETLADEWTAPPQARPQETFRFDEHQKLWQPVQASSPLLTASEMPDRLIIASYNVLAEFEWPPSSARYPALVANILSSRAAADILVLQEVTDHFLPFLMGDGEIRAHYPYSTRGSPQQSSAGPLPSLLNVVVMSRFPLTWEHIPSSRKHKGFAVVTFPTLRTRAPEDSELLPLILAACHLTKGLVDGAIVAKKNEVQRIMGHLSASFPKHPWILAGDFNMPTSSHTIEQARRKQSVSSRGYRYLSGIDTTLMEAGFQDTWLATRVESGESSGVLANQQTATDLYEGEQGATFDPLANSLAAKLVGDGFNNRPQRYDRILVNDRLSLRPRGFNMFGQTAIETTSQPQEPQYASDHWGIRCLLQLPSPGDDAVDNTRNPMGVSLEKAPSSLGGLDEIKECLDARGYLPADSDDAARKTALGVLEKTLIGSSEGASVSAESRAKLNVVVVPVGSYGLGVWTGSSDVDCLCIGSISSRVFFTLALQRLKRASSAGITVLRRVKANSGTMLELDICGIKFDLQYCAATSIAERWPDVMMRPSSDPAFALPLQTMAKLKSARDLYYLRRSVPDMAQYRLAHLFIKAWAKSRGLYAPKFGLLGGIHISVMLVPVCKVLAHDGGMPSTADILTSFFHHYARFDWKKDMVFDPFFHKKIKYHRTFREPLCLLGWHAPSLNKAPNASHPTVETLATELTRASSLLSREGVEWDEFLGSGSANDEFRQAFNSYVKIEAHYWGSSPAKGLRFLGWLESLCVRVLVDIDRKIPGLSARIWPARFVDDASIGDDQDGSENHACYLVGLEWRKSKEEGSEARGALQAVLQEFEALIRGDQKYYDAASCWMSASLVRRTGISGLRADDQSRWSDAAAFGDSDSDGDASLGDEDEAEDEGGEREGVETVETDGGPAAWAKKKAAGRPRQRGPQAKTGRFRTALDVMNRLRWDAGMDASDYIVGYLDRFVGARERSLEQWKSEQTDEEFIPQHRILYFKRRSDGRVVWERRTRIDEVFGSGVEEDGPCTKGTSSTTQE